MMKFGMHVRFRVRFPHIKYGGNRSAGLGATYKCSTIFTKTCFFLVGPPFFEARNHPGHVHHQKMTLYANFHAWLTKPHRPFFNELKSLD